MSQPEWVFLTNLGDADLIEHGGLFVYTDKTGVYPPEMERLERDGKKFEVHRVVLEPCTFEDGILSDNPFHKDYPAWFADSLESVAASMDYDIDELRADFCSDDAKKRAFAWRAVLDHHGWANGDEYPLRLKKSEVEARYKQGETD